MSINRNFVAHECRSYLVGLGRNTKSLSRGWLSGERYLDEPNGKSAHHVVHSLRTPW